MYFIFVFPIIKKTVVKKLGGERGGSDGYRWCVKKTGFKLNNS